MLHFGLTVTGSFFEVSRRGVPLYKDTADAISEAQFTTDRRCSQYKTQYRPTIRVRDPRPADAVTILLINRHIGDLWHVGETVTAT